MAASCCGRATRPHDDGSCMSADPAWEQERATWPHHELSRFIDAGGLRWHVQRCGRGPELLLIHGTGASTHSWRDLLPLLAADFSVIALDLPGHGFTSSPGAAQRTIRGMSAAVSALLRALQIEPQYCVGHSAGAVILCRMALDREITPRGHRQYQRRLPAAVRGLPAFSSRRSRVCSPAVRCCRACWRAARALPRAWRE